MRILWLPALLVGCCFNTYGIEKDATPAVPINSGVYGHTQSPNAIQPPPPDLSKPVALRIVGSNVKNLKGEYLGRIENVTLNPESKQIEYALLDMNYPMNSSRVTAVPWQMLNYVWDQGQVGGLPGAVQMFRLDVDKARFAQAPTLEKTRLASLLQPEFRQQLFAFYGNGVDSAVGATGSAGTVGSGSAVGGATAATPAASANTWTTGAGFIPGGDFVTVLPIDTNTVASINGAATTTNSTAGGGATQTNLFPGTSHPFPGGTNIFPGAPATLGAGATNGVSSQGGVTGTQATSGQQGGTATKGATATTTAPPAGRGSTWTPATPAMVPATPSTTSPSGTTGNTGTSGQNSPGTSVTPAVTPTLQPVPSPVAPVTPTVPPASTPRTGATAPRTR